jgi:hypothetical protein
MMELYPTLSRSLRRKSKSTNLQVISHQTNLQPNKALHEHHFESDFFINYTKSYTSVRESKANLASGIEIFFH